MKETMKERCIYCGSDVYYDGTIVLIKCSMCGNTLAITKFENELLRMKEAIEEGKQAKAELKAAQEQKEAADQRLFAALSSLDGILASQQKETEIAEKLASDFDENKKVQAAMSDLLGSLKGDVSSGFDTVSEVLTVLTEGQESAGQKLEMLHALAGEMLKSQGDILSRLQMQSDVLMQLRALSIDSQRKQELTERFMAWSQNIQQEDNERLKVIAASSGELLERQKIIDGKVDELQKIAEHHQETLEAFQSEWKLSQLEELRQLYRQAESFQYDRNYDLASEYYHKVITKGGGDAEVYWRLLLCHYCVSYQQGDDGRLVPIILNPDLTDPSEMSLRRDLYNHITQEQQDHYVSELEKIDRILDKYRQVHSSIEYDVFISVKQQNNGRTTIDSDIASSLYDSLTEKGLKVFNSRRCKAEMAGKLYEPYIISALMSAKALIVVGTCAENMNSQWVRNEWSRFQWLQKREIERTGKTDRTLLCYLAMGMDPKDIPRALDPSRQAIIDGINADKEITAALAHLIRPRKTAGTGDVETGRTAPVSEPVPGPAPGPGTGTGTETGPVRGPGPENPNRWKTIAVAAIAVLAVLLLLALKDTFFTKDTADQPETAAELQTENALIAAAESETAAQTVTETVMQTEPETVVQAEAETVVQTETEPAPQTETGEPETEAPETEEPETEVQTRALSLDERIENYLDDLRPLQLTFCYIDSSGYMHNFTRGNVSSRAVESGRIFVIEYVLELVESGELDDTKTLRNLMAQAATHAIKPPHQIIEMFTGDFADGLDLLCEYVDEMGYSDTILNQFNEDKGHHAKKANNKTSAADVALSMEHIWQRARGGDELAAWYIKKLATDLTAKDGICDALSNEDGVGVISNIAASGDSWENDVALVQRDDSGNPVIISIMMNNDMSYYEKMTVIHELSQMVWEGM